MANDIDKTSPHYKGDFGSIYEVNKKFPTGGVAGDFVVIEGWAHYWNADRATWCVNAERDSYWDELITNIIEKFKLVRGATYMGVASLDTVPAKAIGAKMYYFATVAGTYKNFGDLVVPQGINVLYSENGSSWVNTTLLEVAQELGVSTKKVVSQKALNDALNLKANQSSVNEALAKKADKEEMNRLLSKKANTADVDTKFTEEKKRVDGELDKKFDKESVAQESGEAEDKVMSQKAVTDKLSDLQHKTDEFLIENTGTQSTETAFFGNIKKGETVILNFTEFVKDYIVNVFVGDYEDGDPIIRPGNVGFYEISANKDGKLNIYNVSKKPFKVLVRIKHSYDYQIDTLNSEILKIEETGLENDTTIRKFEPGYFNGNRIDPSGGYHVSINLNAGDSVSCHTYINSNIPFGMYKNGKYNIVNTPQAGALAWTDWTFTVEEKGDYIISTWDNNSSYVNVRKNINSLESLTNSISSLQNIVYGEKETSLLQNKKQIVIDIDNDKNIIENSKLIVNYESSLQLKWIQFVIKNVDGKILSSSTILDTIKGSTNLDVPQNAKYFFITLSDADSYNTKINYISVSNSSLSARINDILDELDLLNKKVSKNIFTVKKDGSGDFTSFTDMLKKLKDNVENKIVYVYAGEYDIFAEKGGADYVKTIDSTNVDWKDVNEFVPKNTTIIGLGEVILKYTPSDEEIIDAAHSFLFSPLNISDSCHIENLTIIGSNCRYCIHDEGSGNSRYDNAVHEYVNIRAIRKKNTIGGARADFAAGINARERWFFESCTFESENDQIWYCHTNTSKETDSASIIMNNCVFKKLNKTDIVENENIIHFVSGTHLTKKNYAYINNCYIDGNIYITGEDENKWKLRILNCNYSKINMKNFEINNNLPDVFGMKGM